MIINNSNPPKPRKGLADKGVSMLNLLAQTYDYTVTTDKGSAGMFALFTGGFLLFALVVYLVTVVGMWKVFEKAGRPGWAALIPVYNMWVLAEMAGKPGWWALVSLGGIIPLLGFFAGIASFVLFVIVAIEIAKAFGKEPVFAALLVIVPLVGFPMLGFGDAKYTAPAGPTAPTPPSNTPVNPAPPAAPAA